MRIGQGFDIHRLEEGRDLILAGIKIDTLKGSIAHSDGDVLTHALIDAILGAFAKGDIGTLFPDTDDKYKDISSLKLLKKAYSLVPNTIVNIDSTIILQEPKLRKYIDSMRENIATTLGLDIDRVSIKAKTAENCLNELGTSDAIAAEVVVLFM